MAKNGDADGDICADVVMPAEEIQQQLMAGEYRVILQESGEIVLLDTDPLLDMNQAGQDDDAIKLLNLWGLPELVTIFKDQKIDLECFKYIVEDDVNKLIPDNLLAAKIKFKGKLAEWRIENNFLPITIAETMSARSNMILDWLQHNKLSSGNASPSVSRNFSPICEYNRNPSPKYYNKNDVLDLVIRTTKLNLRTKIYRRNEITIFK